MLLGVDWIYIKYTLKVTCLKMNSVNSANSGSGFKPPKTKRPSTFLNEEEIDKDELGAETEAEKQMKVLLQKQLHTKVSLKDQFSQHRTFCSPSTYNPLTELIKGSCTLEQFKKVEKNEELHQELQRCGLTEEEIVDYLAFKDGQRKGNYNIDPVIWQNKVKAIEEKIKIHNEELLKPQAFKNVKKLTRHEMEIERTLYAGCPDKSKLSTLVSMIEDDQSADINDAFKHIKNLSQKLLNARRKRRKIQVNKIQQLTSDDSQTESSTFQFDCNIHHVIIPLEEDEVKEKRLSTDEIRKLPRFENYQIGDPSETLYLKNLHPKITIFELRSLFGNFEEENKSPIHYKICVGRMKGQAFIKFSDVKIAEKALQHVNGYSLRGKPIVIQFGRRN